MSSIIKGVSGIYTNWIKPQDITFVETKDESVKKNLVIEEDEPVKKDLVKKDPVKKDLVKKDPVKKDLVKKDPGSFQFKPIVFNDEEDDTIYRMVLMLLGEPVCNINNKSFYVLPIKSLKNMNIYPYRHQRVFNSEHVETLKNGILKTGYLYHPIILVNIKERNEISIIDGQHRFKALKSLLSTFSDEKLDSIKVQIEVINLENDDAAIMEVYRNVNTCEPIDMKKIISEQDYVGFIHKMKLRFGKKVIIESDKQYKHYLIESRLKTELMKYNLLLNIPADILMNKMVSMNEELKEMALLLNKLTPLEKQRCEKHDFWLGTDFPNWVKRIN
jgi:hypothetical protein